MAMTTRADEPAWQPATDCGNLGIIERPPADREYI